MILWDNNKEGYFFIKALENFASPEQVFYNLSSGYFAYVPKGISGEGQTLQSRNSLIGQFTEKWCKDLFSPIVKRLGLYAVNSVVCEEISLPKRSNADLAFCLTDDIVQKPENIKLIFEIKMSIVSNYKYINRDTIDYVGDYKSHKGNPSLLRSDSMLKAIGKAINIRVSGSQSSAIPIIILGNTPINNSYIRKVDFLKNAGVIQGFWSLNPNPTDTEHIRETPKKGFLTISNNNDLFDLCSELLNNEMNFFSSMLSKPKLGEIISIASKEKTESEKAEKFIQLIREI